MCVAVDISGARILLSAWVIYGYLRGCLSLHCALFIATIFLGYQQTLTVRWRIAFSICPLLLSKWSSWPSLWPVWHLSFSSIPNGEGWGKRWNKGEENFTSASICLFQGIQNFLVLFEHLLHASADSSLCPQQSPVLSPHALLELWLSHSAPWHHLAMGSPWSEKGERQAAASFNIYMGWMKHCFLWPELQLRWAWEDCSCRRIGWIVLRLGFYFSGFQWCWLFQTND